MAQGTSTSAQSATPRVDFLRATPAQIAPWTDVFVKAILCANPRPTLELFLNHPDFDQNDCGTAPRWAVDRHTEWPLQIHQSIARSEQELHAKSLTLTIHKSPVQMMRSMEINLAVMIQQWAATTQKVSSVECEAWTACLQRLMSRA